MGTGIRRMFKFLCDTRLMAVNIYSSVSVAVVLASLFFVIASNMRLNGLTVLLDPLAEPSWRNSIDSDEFVETTYVVFPLAAFLANASLVVRELSLVVSNDCQNTSNYTYHRIIDAKFTTDNISVERTPVDHHHLRTHTCQLFLSVDAGSRSSVNLSITFANHDIVIYNCSETNSYCVSSGGNHRRKCWSDIDLRDLLIKFLSCEPRKYASLYLAAWFKVNYAIKTKRSDAVNSSEVKPTFALRLRYDEVCHLERLCPWVILPTFRGFPAFTVTSKDTSAPTGLTFTEETYLVLNSKARRHEVGRSISSWYPPSETSCKFSFTAMMSGIHVGSVDVVLHTQRAKLTITSLHGDRGLVWIDQEVPIGAIPENYRVEFVARAGDGRSNIALANASLHECGKDSAVSLDASQQCRRGQYRCRVTGVCLTDDRVCDLHQDCLYGEDEAQCDAVQLLGGCTFENSTCGWDNILGDHFDWMRRQGPTPTDDTGPAFDHTTGDKSGHYMYIEASDAKMGHTALLESRVFPALYPVTSADACYVRFFYHMFGVHTGELVLFAKNSSERIELWYANRNKGDRWHRAAVEVPRLGSPYTLQFAAVRGLRHRGDIALDDVSLSYGCFQTISEKAGNDLEPDQKDQPRSHTKFLIAAAISVCCVMVWAAVSVFIIRRCRRRARENKRPLSSPYELRERNLGDDSSFMFPTSSQLLDHIVSNNPLYSLSGNVDTWDHLKHLRRSDIQLSTILGRGAFGEVYLGYLSDNDSTSTSLAVAVKTLPEMVTEKREREFGMEATIMSKFNHPNIVNFFGVCFDQHPKMIVLELLSGGDLNTFVKESRPRKNRVSDVSVKDLLLLALDVAMGCHYLEESHFIHRDIAARNCLLTAKNPPHRNAKIADFGLSKDIYNADYYRKVGVTMLPIKWMPPESFLDGTFTSKTDVWAYGVLLWETFSMGQVPYPGLTNSEVIERVSDGLRMDAPMNCAPAVYDIMLMCWRTQPSQRPRFCHIIDILESCLVDYEVLSSSLPVYLHDESVGWGSRISDAVRSDQPIISG